MNLETLRSDCPINYLLEIVGDKWSLIIIRDIMLDGKKSYGELLDSDEKIATNILAKRLAMLEEWDILTKERDPKNGKKFIYHLTEKGLDLLPLFVEMVFWSEKHAPLPIPEDRKELVTLAHKDREAFIEDAKERLRNDGSVAVL